MKCQICRREKLVFYCVTVAGSHIIACTNCATVCGLKMIEEVLTEKEVRGEGLEGEGSREGQGMPDLRDKRE
jgi:ribosome-binding protein aMBF1 (putative translation factor)